MPRAYHPIAIVGVGALFPGSPRRGRLLARHPRRPRPASPTCRRRTGCIEDYYDPDPAAPDKTYGRRGAFLAAVDFDPLEFGVPPSIAAGDRHRPAARADRRAAGARRRDPRPVRRARPRARQRASSASTRRRSCWRTWSSRLQRPVWVKALRERGLPEDEAQRDLRRASPSTTCRGRRARSPACSATSSPAASPTGFDLRRHQLRRRRGVRQLAGRAVDGASTSCTLGQTRPGDHRRRRHAQRHLHVHVLQQDAGAVADRRLPAVRRRGRRHDARRGPRRWSRSSASADAERDGDRDLRRDPRGRLVLRRPRARASTRRVPRGRRGRCAAPTRRAGYGPDTVELVEAHGTGTKAGDAAEVDGAARRCSTTTGARTAQWCALGSVKSQIGHTKAAAGAAGLIKAVLALHHKVLPPTIKVERPNPALELRDEPVLPQHRGAAVDPRRRPSAARRRSARSASAAATSTSTLEEYAGHGARAARIRALAEPSWSCWPRRPAASPTLACARRTRQRRARTPGTLARRPAASDAGDAARAGAAGRRRGGRGGPARQARAGGRSRRRRRRTRVLAPRGVHYARARRRPAPSPSCSPGRAASTSAWAPTSRWRSTRRARVWDARGRRAARTARALHDVVFPRAGVRRTSERAGAGRAAHRDRVGAARARRRTASRCWRVLRAVGVAARRRAPATASAS